jgi:hypothetical protein
VLLRHQALILFERRLLMCNICRVEFVLDLDVYLYRTILIFGFYVAKRYRLTIFVRVLDTVIFFVKLN